MAIPIQNIYYLLCYAWDKLDEKEIVNVNAEDNTELIDLFARVLVNGTVHLFKRGLDRNYVERTQVMPAIKGKLLVGNSVKSNSFLYGKAHCSYDEFDHNILHNQILKTTFRRLIKTDNLEKDIKREVLSLFRRFQGIDEIDLSPKFFQQVRLNRNNYFYDFLLKICAILCENLFINEQTGHYSFMDFERDERKMAYLFEAFVRNFYRKELPEWEVSREDIFWDFHSEEAAALKMLPKMQTDISLICGDRKIIIDTKYYKEALQRYYDREKLISANLYQLYAYLGNVERKDERSKNAMGVLLYPTVQDDFEHRFRHRTHQIVVKTIDLDQVWRGIREELLGLVNRNE